MFYRRYILHLLPPPLLHMIFLQTFNDLYFLIIKNYGANKTLTEVVIQRIQHVPAPEKSQFQINILMQFVKF